MLGVRSSHSPHPIKRENAHREVYRSSLKHICTMQNSPKFIKFKVPFKIFCVRK